MEKKLTVDDNKENSEGKMNTKINNKWEKYQERIEEWESKLEITKLRYMENIDYGNLLMDRLREIEGGEERELIKKKHTEMWEERNLLHSEQNKICREIKILTDVQRYCDKNEEATPVMKK